MTSSNAQSQQEVDDILSSIRQMIAEEEEANGSSAKDSAVDDSSDKILDLTKLVQDDGSVIELSAQSTPHLPAVDMPKDDMKKTLEAQFLSQDDAQQGTTIINRNDRNNRPNEINPKTWTTQMPTPNLSSTPISNLDSMPSQKSIPTPQPQAASTQSSHLMSSQNSIVAVPPTSVEKESLLSDHTIQESAAAFAALSRATQQHLSSSHPHPTPSATVSSGSVDDLMRNLLQPLLQDWLKADQQQELLKLLLKGWLDAHLPSLVKNLVLEQIEKVSQQPNPSKANEI